MLTREEVVEIMSYCKEHKVTYKSRLEELNIPVWRFYDSKSRYAAEQSSDKTAQGEFIELPHSGSFVPVPSFAGTTGRKQKGTPTTPNGLKEIEIRMPDGSAIRICGELNCFQSSMPATMFNLNDSMRYLLYNRPTDMRKNFHTLSGIITDTMGQDPCNGNVYIFINRDRIKLLHWEPGGMVLYSKLLKAGTLGKPDFANNNEVCTNIEWRELVMIVEGIMETRDSRRTKLLSPQILRK